MRFELHTDAPLELSCDLVALGAFEGKLQDVRLFQELDRELAGALSRIAGEESFEGKDEQRLCVHTQGQLSAKRVLLLGLGPREGFDVTDTRRYGARLADEARKRGCAHVAVALPPLDPSANERAAQFLVEGALLGEYRFERYRAEAERTKSSLADIAVLAPGGFDALSLARGQVIAAGVCLARDLVNEPPASLTPRKLADAAREMARDSDIECKVLTPKDCEKLGMGLYLAVQQGSAEEGRFIHLTYRPKGREKPKRRIALVGKGVTFDSGGLSLKPTASMLDMKTDMAGAAAVIGAMSVLPAIGLQTEVHGIVAAAENMVSGRAYRLGDVYRGMSGVSVEIANTDAEGRLTLADALSYALKLQPDELIDVATLTGACVVALGPDIAGVMGNDNAVIERFLAAARRVGEEVWQLPLPARLAEQLKSEVADLKNVGERWGGALTAGLFLKRFVNSTSWIHVDIAGPASAEKAKDHQPVGGSGFGVLSLVEYLSARDRS